MLLERQNLIGLLLMILLLGSCSRDSLPKEPMMDKAVNYLWAQQAEDGGWHSPTHGFLKGGQAHTPFVLFALTQHEKSENLPMPQVQQALDFLRTHMDSTGVLGGHDPDILEYPNYATAYALRVFAKWGNDKDQENRLIDKMRKYLLQQQFYENRGIYPNHEAFGAWGFGEQKLAAGTVGHIDLSHHRKVLQALQESGGVPERELAYSDLFLSRMQKAGPGTDSIGFDGGFFNTPTAGAANKAGMDSTGSFYFSYGTATCEGILSLLASGVPKEDPSLIAAIHWLKQHPELRYDEAIPEGTQGAWRQVMIYYHLWVRAEVYAALDWSGEWKTEMKEILRGKQQNDGSFSNPLGAANKEDDPILATAMMVMAMRHIDREDPREH